MAYIHKYFVNNPKFFNLPPKKKENKKLPPDLAEFQIYHPRTLGVRVEGLRTPRVRGWPIFAYKNSRR